MRTLALKPASIVNSLVGFILLALILVVVGAVLLAMPQVLPQSHATDRHASEPVLIRQCLENNGPSRVFRAKDEGGGFKYFLTCQLEDGRYGFQIAKWDKFLKKWVEKTSFIKGDGTAKSLLDYLNQNGATPYNGAPVP